MLCASVVPRVGIILLMTLTHFTQTHTRGDAMASSGNYSNENEKSKCH
jgi:hypothetical protein